MAQPSTQAAASRVFTRYRAEADAQSGILLREDFRERDRDSGRFFDKTVDTSIRLLPSCPAEEAEAIAVAAGEVRNELDVAGVKLYFDRPKADPVNLYPKWKYRRNGQFREIAIPRDTIDQDVMDLVLQGADFFRQPLYKKWYGRKMQYVREGIIIEALCETYGPYLAPQDPERGRAPQSPPTPDAPLTPELQRGIVMLVDDFSGLYELPAQAETLVARVAHFSHNLFEYQFTPSGARPRPQVHPETLRNAVLRAVERKFSHDPAMCAALREIAGKKIVLDRIGPSA